MKLDALKPLIADHLKSSRTKAALQLLDSIGTYALLWALMAWTVTFSWWLTIPIALLSGAVLVRVFIIMHDCGHGSFYNSRKANDFWGFVTGMLAFTPYDQWKGQHATHHGCNGDLDRRGVGDMWTMTLQEYQDATAFQRLCYRFGRHIVVLLGVVPLILFMVQHRIPAKSSNKRERRSVWTTNIALVLLATGMSFIFGFWTWLLLQTVVLAVAGGMGIWLFYAQHQFEGVHWARRSNWSYIEAALKGSSYLKLPRGLQWFTGNIGYHHIHHLDSRIPNYNLQACHDQNPVFHDVPTLDLPASIRAFRLKLWDESRGRLIDFREAHRLDASRCA